MSYAEPLGSRSDRLVESIAPVNVEHQDRIRWGPIIAGIFVAIATQLILGALGVAIGLTISSEAADLSSVSIGVSIWSIISLLIALFIGSWVTTAGCAPMNNKTAMLHGFILWATTLAVSAWLFASGVTGAFGVAASSAGDVLNQVQQPGGLSIPNQAPNISPERAEQIAATTAKAAWYFIIGSLLGLAAALIGSTVGAKKPRASRNAVVATPQPPENISRR